MKKSSEQKKEVSYLMDYPEWKVCVDKLAAEQQGVDLRRESKLWYYNNFDHYQKTGELVNSGKHE